MPADPTLPADCNLDADRLRARRIRNQARHAQALARLMAEREDLRGVHPLADLVAESLKWTA